MTEDPGKLAIWLVADMSAVAWGVAAITAWSPADLFGDSTTLILVVVGVLGAVSLAGTLDHFAD